MLEYAVSARRTARADAVAECARCPVAVVRLDTDPAGRQDAFNPAELLLASLAACMLKGIERVVPMLEFRLAGAAVHVRGVRQDAPPRMLRIEYELVVDTDEPDRRLELLHRNVQRFGTVYNTLAASVELTGGIRRNAEQSTATAAQAPERPARVVEVPRRAEGGG